MSMTAKKSWANFITETWWWWWWW